MPHASSGWSRLAWATIASRRRRGDGQHAVQGRRVAATCPSTGRRGHAVGASRASRAARWPASVSSTDARTVEHDVLAARSLATRRPRSGGELTSSPAQRRATAVPSWSQPRGQPGHPSISSGARDDREARRSGTQPSTSRTWLDAQACALATDVERRSRPVPPRRPPRRRPGQVGASSPRTSCQRPAAVGREVPGVERRVARWRRLVDSQDSHTVHQLRDRPCDVTVDGRRPRAASTQRQAHACTVARAGARARGRGTAGRRTGLPLVTDAASMRRA